MRYRIYCGRGGQHIVKVNSGENPVEAWLDEQGYDSCEHAGHLVAAMGDEYNGGNLVALLELFAEKLHRHAMHDAATDQPAQEKRCPRSPPCWYPAKRCPRSPPCWYPAKCCDPVCGDLQSRAQSDQPAGGEE